MSNMQMNGIKNHHRHDDHQTLLSEVQHTMDDRIPDPDVVRNIRIASQFQGIKLPPYGSKTTLSSYVCWSYAVGHVLNDLTASCWFSFLLVFLRAVLLFQPTDAGLLLLIGQVADGVATPVVGYLSDRTQSKFGKRRLWILAGSLVVMFAVPPIFSPPIFVFFTKSRFLHVFYYACFIILFQFAWASTQVNHQALVPELSKYSYDRICLNSRRSMSTILSNVLVFILAFFILKTNTISSGAPGGNTESLSPADLSSFTYLSVIVVSIGAVFVLIFLSGVPEPTPRPKRLGDLHIEWHDWFRIPSFYLTSIVYTCTRVMANVTQTYLPLFLTVTLHAPKVMIATVPIVMFTSGMLGSGSSEWISRRIGSSGLLLLGCLAVLVPSISVLYLSSTGILWTYAFALILGIGIGLISVSGLTMISDLVGDHCESGAFVYGAMSFGDKLTNGIVIMIVESTTPTFNLAFSAHAELYYRHVMLASPSIAVMITILILLFQRLAFPMPNEIAHRSGQQSEASSPNPINSVHRKKQSDFAQILIGKSSAQPSLVCQVSPLTDTPSLMSRSVSANPGNPTESTALLSAHYSIYTE